MTFLPKAPTKLAHLPEPTLAAEAHSQQLIALIVVEIAQSMGWISFARYMELALYAPALGYYSAGAQKFGAQGDFVTAPEISALFSQTLARQVRQVLQQIEHAPANILELGAGSARMAADVLLALQQQQALPAQYMILEVSADLRALQQQTLSQALDPELLARVVWLDSLPQQFNGVLLANEVLDALPVHVVQQQNGVWHELGVSFDQRFNWQAQPLPSGALYEMASQLGIDPSQDYTTELCPAALGLLASLAHILQQGALIFIDYGFSHAEYYHAQRSQGTLMCHYRHYAHDDPFVYPGLQDITAHVDFTAVVQAAQTHGLELLGYTNQAQFLINCGITEVLGQVSPHDMAVYLPLAAQAQKLLSPAEMGELFKVVALGKALPQPLLGFVRGDKRYSL